MRLDKFLKVSRIIKRRTVASEACDKQRVSVNGHPAKAGKDVKAGDIIEIRFGASTLKARVLKVSETARKEEADGMYEVLGETHGG
jgi:ribosomal 50S subunit-recycling heat shock protein